MNKEELMKLDKEEIIAVLFAVIDQQTKTIERLTREIAELKVQLNQNSKNSSKPPSSDGFKKPKNRSLRKPSGKKPGGQEGHKGNGFTQLRTPDEYKYYEPETCAECPKRPICFTSQYVNETRYEIDIQINTISTAHQTLSVDCPEAGNVLTGSFPEAINGTIQYGVNLKALAVSLNTVGTISINRTHEILSGVFGVPISTGTIAAMVESCAEKVADTVQEIKEVIIEEPLIYLDETGTRVDKRTVWAHVASTDKLTYIDVQPSRGQEGINAAGVLTEYKGKAVHDCWASYFLYTAITHALCNAHLLRELVAVLQNTKQAWAQKLIDLLLAMKQKKEELLLKKRHTASPYFLNKYSKDFDTIIAEALIENPIPIPDSSSKRKPKRGKTGALVDRLIKHKDKYLLFFTDFSVPFDNNQAERDIRMFKVKQKVSGCFRTMDGAKDFAAIMSFVGTARKLGLSVFQAIKDSFLGNPFSACQSKVFAKKGAPSPNMVS